MFSRRKSGNRPQPGRFGKLTIDTSCVNQKKVPPHESRVPQLSFVGFEESKARKNAPARKPGLKQELENSVPVQSGPQAVPQVHGLRDSIHSSVGAIVPTPLEPQQCVGNNLELPPQRSRGHRPQPLDLKQDVSPSDRAIPIGISPTTATSWGGSPPTAGSYGRNISTPIIVVTPAKDHFSVEKEARDRARRPASSVYSRYTNCMSKSMAAGRTPPVPPLPLFSGSKIPLSRFSNVTATTAFEEDMPSGYGLQTGKSIDETVMTSMTTHEKRITAGTPTPRRSKGWWNIITSPFSARSASASLWRSPSDAPGHASEQAPVLHDAAAMGDDAHAGVIFTDRFSDDDELRSAPPATTGYSTTDQDAARSLPQRSDTVSGALDRNDPSVNIYRTPSTGEAAAYYNKNRRFPSLCIQSQTGILMQSPGNDLRGWSPSNSVYRSPLSASDVDSPEVTMMQAALEAEGIASTDHTRPREQTINAQQHPQTAAGTSIFSTPSADELKTPATNRPPPRRGMTERTTDSIWSPLSATPEVKDAYLGMRVGPQATYGEQRQVHVERTPTMQTGPGLAAGTITHSHSHSEMRQHYIETYSEGKVVRPAYVRQDSQGLGISDNERDLFPPPAHIRVKPRLGTDRFGQLTVRSFDDDLSRRPWYRRYFWILAGIVAALLILLIVLLVVLVPPRHRKDVAVEASWMNLTGFPALAVGVSTIIQPNNTVKQDKCVAPTALWSCDTPAAATPNFRLEVRFKNGTLPSNEITSASHNGSELKRLAGRDSWESYLYSPNPAPPSKSDQEYLGRTTDNIREPFNGEDTPFYISLLDATEISSSPLHKRVDSSFRYPYPTDTDLPSTSDRPSTTTTSASSIPSPALTSNAHPTSPLLYPFAASQPLRLYNRGQPSEHYGFYTYFDRTISIINSTSSLSNLTSTEEAMTSNTPLSSTTALCTFSQTRLHIQIWTRRGGTIATLADDGSAKKAAAAAAESSANDMLAPGSFPYPVTVTLDRHGGDASSKGVFCYALDEDGRRDLGDDEKEWIVEDRGVGGKLVDAAEVLGSGLRRRGDGDGTGIDGGTGGCSCAWESG